MNEESLIGKTGTAQGKGEAALPSGRCQGGYGVSSRNLG